MKFIEAKQEQAIIGPLGKAEYRHTGKDLHRNQNDMPGTSPPGHNGCYNSNRLFDTVCF
jgi:hypothetical protein